MTPEQVQQAIQEFRLIYKEVFGVELSDEEAAKKAKALLQLFVCLTEGNFVE